MRTRRHEDPREILQAYAMEELEARLRQAVIEALVLFIDPCCGPDCDDRQFYRQELRVLHKDAERVQRLNRTQLVLDSRTYDAEGVDEYAEVSARDLSRLAWKGITLPWTQPGHGMLLAIP